MLWIWGDDASSRSEGDKEPGCHQTRFHTSQYKCITRKVSTIAPFLPPHPSLLLFVPISSILRNQLHITQLFALHATIIILSYNTHPRATQNQTVTPITPLQHLIGSSKHSGNNPPTHHSVQAPPGHLVPPDHHLALTAPQEAHKPCTEAVPHHQAAIPQAAAVPSMILRYQHHRKPQGHASVKKQLPRRRRQRRRKDFGCDTRPVRNCWEHRVLRELRELKERRVRDRREEGGRSLRCYYFLPRGWLVRRGRQWELHASLGCRKERTERCRMGWRGG